VTIYALAYDLLNEQGSSSGYQRLWDELERLNAHRVQESLWLISLDNTPEEVIEHFKKITDKDDRLWVSSVRTNEYWYRKAKAGTNKWLEENPPN
jgi:CRISPR/Cas system-associated endoribonuclease Cas2